MAKGKTRSDVSASEEIVFAVCEKFFEGFRVAEIVKQIKAEKGETLTREQVYPMLVKARELELIRLCAPIDGFLASKMRDAEQFVNVDESKKITVVAGGVETTIAHVAERAADVALAAIKRIGERKKPVHVGLGAGWSTMTVAANLARNIRNDPDVPHLVLHALSTGFDVDAPRTAPMYFFSFFKEFTSVSFKALFSVPYVETDKYTETKMLPGVSGSFKAKDEIDVVITAFASAKDPHGELSNFVKGEGKRGQAARHTLERGGWVGDVQYRPYSESGPIAKEPAFRAVTLFELDQLADIAADEDKAVVLVCGPCRVCNRTREDALLPLLREPSLAVWSHLVLDENTAQKCLRLAGKGARSKRATSKRKGR